MVTYDSLRRDSDIKIYIERADDALGALGYTEHSFAHVGRVAKVAGDLLRDLGMDEKTVELARIAGLLHDIGNVVNRVDHSQSGALMAFRLLDRRDVPVEDICTIITAIGNHDEGTGVPVDHISAALILADKSDVRRSRVRNHDLTTFDIHDRVNYSVTNSVLALSEDKTELCLSLTVDTQYSSIMDYFEIFLERMNLCRRAAGKLGLRFRLVINEQFIL
jgi:metal-dependent HD superfamily phosphatase/phosphodiesterase